MIALVAWVEWWQASGCKMSENAPANPPPTHQRHQADPAWRVHDGCRTPILGASCDAGRTFVCRVFWLVARFPSGWWSGGMQDGSLAYVWYNAPQYGSQHGRSSGKRFQALAPRMVRNNCRRAPDARQMPSFQRSRDVRRASVTRVAARVRSVRGRASGNRLGGDRTLSVRRLPDAASGVRLANVLVILRASGGRRQTTAQLFRAG